jgi:hypothetical protein
MALPLPVYIVVSALSLEDRHGQTLIHSFRLFYSIRSSQSIPFYPDYPYAPSTVHPTRVNARDWTIENNLHPTLLTNFCKCVLESIAGERPTPNHYQNIFNYNRLKNSRKTVGRLCLRTSCAAQDSPCVISSLIYDSVLSSIFLRHDIFHAICDQHTCRIR